MCGCGKAAGKGPRTGRGLRIWRNVIVGLYSALQTPTIPREHWMAERRGDVRPGISYRME